MEMNFFLPKWPQWNNTCNELQVHMHMKWNIRQVCIYSFRFSCCFFFFTWRSRTGLKFHFDQNYRYEIHSGLSFISPQFMWSQAKSWLNIEVRLSNQIKSHTGLSSFRLSCERTLKEKTKRFETWKQVFVLLIFCWGK